MQINKIKELSLQSEQVEIKKSEVMRLLGYEVEHNDLMVEEAVKRLIAESYGLIKPKSCFIILERKDHDFKGELKIDEITFNIGNIIASQIKKADKIALFICTAGKGIEEKSKNLLKNNEMLDGYIMDLIGSEAAESIADIIHRQVEKEVIEAGLNTTNRFSPGYCNWNVEEQVKLFSFFGENSCNIKLTDSALMNPIKSVSGMIGIGKDVSFQKYNCKACDDDKCIYRRLGR